MARETLAFATPRKLPRAKDLEGRVAVLDVAFASEASGGGFDKITLPLIEGLGARLAAWVDHHDHVLHERYAKDPRFVLATKAQHGACPEMLSPELVQRLGPVDTLVCHTDFDGLASAAKWMLGGEEPYAGCDDDARAIDTRIGTPSPIAARIDRALRARGRDPALFGAVVRLLVSRLADAALWEPIDRAGAELVAIERATRRLAEGYARVELRRCPFPRVTTLAYLDATGATARGERYDRTQLLLLGQERASVAVLVDRDNLTLAAPFDSGVNFLKLMGLSGGMPTLVSVPKARLGEALAELGVGADDASRLVG
ncbi:MAG TPA: hypothetical protein PLR99_05875 [Polyangiaceae bacterium]|nr:hypothetical protein [Polyangiaceae bacterium]